MKERLNTQIYIKDGKHYIRLKNTGCEEKEYEIIKSDNLYDMIHDGIPLQVYKKCVIGFSMSEYRQKYKISSDSLVDVKIDSIIDCFFVGLNQTAADFTYCNFVSTDEVIGIMLEDSIFYNGKVVFSYCQIGNLDFSMKGCHFINCEVIIAYSEFGNKDVYFSDTIFEDVCGIQFTGTNFGNDGEISFRNMRGIDAEENRPIKKRKHANKDKERIDGKLDFYKCVFGEKMLDFANMNCPKWQFSFWEIETPSMPVDFVDSVVGMILLYKANINGLLDFRIALAEHIVIQESIIRDCVLLGNQGYKNYTCYCFKNSALLGRLRIQNRFSKRLFHNQIQYAYDPQMDGIVLCPTSSTDKAQQLTMLAENYQSEGDLDNADAAYVLSKRYRSAGRLHDIWTDYGAVGRTEKYKNSFIRRSWAYITISVRFIGALIAWLFDKLFLDILCGNYATKPAKFLFWILMIVTGFALMYYRGFGTGAFLELDNPLYHSMNPLRAAWIYSLQVFLQIENGELMPTLLSAYYFLIIEKVVGLAMFSIFAVSYTRKVIK